MNIRLHTALYTDTVLLFTLSAVNISPPVGCWKSPIYRLQACIVHCPVKCQASKETESAINKIDFCFVFSWIFCGTNWHRGYNVNVVPGATCIPCQVADDVSVSSDQNRLRQTFDYPVKTPPAAQRVYSLLWLIFNVLWSQWTRSLPRMFYIHFHNRNISERIFNLSQNIFLQNYCIT